MANVVPSLKTLCSRLFLDRSVLVLNLENVLDVHEFASLHAFPELWQRTEAFVRESFGGLRSKHSIETLRAALGSELFDGLNQEHEAVAKKIQFNKRVGAVMEETTPSEALPSAPVIGLPPTYSSATPADAGLADKRIDCNAPLAERVEALRERLGLETGTIVSVIEQACAELGLTKELEGLNLVDKANVCLQTASDACLPTAPDPPTAGAAGSTEADDGAPNASWSAGRLREWLQSNCVAADAHAEHAALVALAEETHAEILEEERAVAEFNERASSVIVSEGRGGKGKSVLDIAREGEEQERRELIESGMGRFGVR